MIHSFRYQSNSIDFRISLIIIMNYLLIEPSVIHLKGITRTSYFKIMNRNDFLAVSFQTVIIGDVNNILNIFPDNGILLGGEQQKIRVKLQHENSSECKKESTFKIGVRFTYKTQFNRRYLSKNNMEGWNQLPSEIFQKEVKIVSGGEKEAIEDYIKEQIFFQKTFGTEQLNLSAIKKKDQFQKQNQSDLSLNISSRFEHQKGLQTSRNQDNKHLNQSIEVNQIFPLVFGESRAKQEISKNKITQIDSQKNLALFQSRLIKDNLSKNCSLEMKTVQNNNFLQESNLSNSLQYINKKKTFDLVILAIISAFFVALGNNIARIFS